MKVKTDNKIFRYEDGNEILNNDYINELNNLMDITGFQKENLIIFCVLGERKKKRHVIKIKKIKNNSSI